MRLINYYNTLCISKKLRFINVASALITGAVVVISIIIYHYYHEKHKTVEEATVYARVLAENIAQSLHSNDLDAVSNTLASVENNTNIRQTYALDNAWNIIGLFHKGDDFLHQSKVIPKIIKNQNLWDDGSFYAVVPIMFEQQQQGYLVIIASLHDFYLQTAKNILFIFITITVALMLTERFRKLLQESILNSIADLNAITTLVIKTRDFNHTITPHTHDEIGELAEKFNSMLSDLRIYHKELDDQKAILHHQANHDILTSLPNRVLFYDRLVHAMNAANRSGEHVALFFIDLDKFKEVNDTYGHEYGDQLLVQVGNRLQHIIRSNDTLSRLGGDEFTIIVDTLKAPYQASILAQKVLDIFDEPFDIGVANVISSCSIGISLSPDDTTDPHDLLKYADIAMYRSKNIGRNSFHFYTEEMTREVQQRVEMQNAIRQALEAKTFSVHYQPKFDLRTSELTGLEALVRWFKPDGSAIAPDVFLPIAEETGLVLEINNQVMHCAIKEAKRLSQAAQLSGPISINIVSSQIEDEKFVEELKHLLGRYQCDPHLIKLEIVESQIMQNPDTAISVLNQISAMGVSIAIDDFGTGYSSLAYLKHLPIDEIKIDRSFIQELPHNRDDAAIVKAIIAMAYSLHINVVAEGVETDEQLQFLDALGCYEIQGFYFSKPLDTKTLEAFLNEKSQVSRTIAV